MPVLVLSGRATCRLSVVLPMPLSPRRYDIKSRSLSVPPVDARL